MASTSKYSVEGPAYVREHFFGGDPRLQALIADKTDDDLKKLRRGATTTASCSRRTRRPSTSRAARP
jgi:pyruvate dehydrogenase complex dehydrogenase (E1) component